MLLLSSTIVHNIFTALEFSQERSAFWAFLHIASFAIVNMEKQVSLTPVAFIKLSACYNSHGPNILSPEIILTAIVLFLCVTIHEHSPMSSNL